jgi:hypothetical protein
MVLWLAVFTIATFCWVVVIEHGPENFVAGSKIEIENLGSLVHELVARVCGLGGIYEREILTSK